MAAIHEVDLGNLAGVYPSGDSWREFVANAFWAWFHDHRDDRVTTVRVWFFSKTLYVRDLYQIFILLFGPEL